MKREKVILESEGTGWILSPTKAIKVLKAKKKGDWETFDKIIREAPNWDVYPILDRSEEDIDMLIRFMKEKKLKKVI